MFTVQLALVPLRVASAEACSVMIFGLPVDKLSSTKADALHAIFAVDEIVASTVIVKLKTNLPEAVLDDGAVVSSVADGSAWNIPVCGSRYPLIFSPVTAFCPQSVSLIANEHRQTARAVRSFLRKVHLQ